MSKKQEEIVEGKKSDLQDIVEVVANALHTKNQHFVLRTETKVVGSFYPAEQAVMFERLQQQLDVLTDRLSQLESSQAPAESASAEHEEKKGSPESN